MNNKKQLTKLLNVNYLKYSNKTLSCGEYDLPALYCNTDEYPDYIALYSNKNEYFKTKNTAVAFYQYDNVFDGKNGLFWAIYFNDENRLKFFKERFKNVKFIITPDYSILGDIQYIENIYRIFRARIVAIWFIYEIGAIVIPNISFSDYKTSKIAFSGLENSSVIAISTKGHLQDKEERKRLTSNIRLIVDTLNLKAIIVYDVCINKYEVEKVFLYAIEKGIKVIFPDNLLRNRNIFLSKGGFNESC